jgi:hypothetical protein
MVVDRPRAVAAAMDRGLALTAGLLSPSDDDSGMVQLQAVQIEVDAEW